MCVVHTKVYAQELNSFFVLLSNFFEIKSADRELFETKVLDHILHKYDRRIAPPSPAPNQPG